MRTTARRGTAGAAHELWLHAPTQCAASFSSRAHVTSLLIPILRNSEGRSLTPVTLSAASSTTRAVRAETDAPLTTTRSTSYAALIMPGGTSACPTSPTPAICSQHETRRSPLISAHAWFVAAARDTAADPP